MDIDKELRDLAAKHLPQAVGEELQRRLKQADADARSVGSLTAELAATRAQLDGANHKAETLAMELRAHAELYAREEAVAKREHDADVHDLKVKLEAADSKVIFAKEVALGLVRNTGYRSSVFESVENRAIQVPSGSYMQTAPRETVSKTFEQPAT